MWSLQKVISNTQADNEMEQHFFVAIELKYFCYFTRRLIYHFILKSMQSLV